MNKVTFEQLPEYNEGSIQILGVTEGRAFLAEVTAEAKPQSPWFELSSGALCHLYSAARLPERKNIRAIWSLIL